MGEADLSLGAGGIAQRGTTPEPIPSAARSARPSRRGGVVALVLLLLVAVGLRVWDLPGRYEIRDVDEGAYTAGCLELVEGLTPVYKDSPAGPLTWLGWACAGSQAAGHLLWPTPEERAVPLQVRPFVAVNHALFDNYHDMSSLRWLLLVTSDVIGVVAVAAAFAVGLSMAGLPGGVLLGGIFAAAPMIVWYGGQARPFDEGWSFAAIAMYFAVCHRGRLAVWGSGICMGLSISSRIDMLPVLPLVWAEVWLQIPGRRAAVLAALRQTGIAAVTTLLLAPWLLTNLVGNLRTIFSVRFSTPARGPIPMSAALREFAWQEGLGLVAVLFVVGVGVGLVRWRLRRPLVCLYTLLLLTTVTKSTGQGIGHQGAAVIPMFLLTPLALAALGLSQRVAWAVVAVVLSLPVAIEIHRIVVHRRSYVPDHATQWVQDHVPAGSNLYLSASLHDPLPTPASADAIWKTFIDINAPMKKFGAGLARFKLTTPEIPRALSEENMIDERAEGRGWYILGSRAWLPDPRYDIHLYGESQVFTPPLPLQGFGRTGGTIIWRGDGPLDSLPSPAAKWVNANGGGTYIYCSDDIRRQLH